MMKKYNKGRYEFEPCDQRKKYFNEGYDEVEGPVTVDITSTDNDWDITLEERPDWVENRAIQKILLKTVFIPIFPLYYCFYKNRRK